jgi:hypothetical protein
MEEREMRWNEVPLGREVRPSQRIKALKGYLL